jgi:hypothetical protein
MTSHSIEGRPEWLVRFLGYAPRFEPMSDPGVRRANCGASTKPPAAHPTRSLNDFVVRLPKVLLENRLMVSDAIAETTDGIVRAAPPMTGSTGVKARRNSGRLGSPK